MPHPVVFAAPAKSDLSPAPLPAHWIIEGAPRARSKRLATSPDGATVAIVWTCSAGRFHWHYPADEFVHIISGEVFVTDEKGESRRLGPGDMAFFPAGGTSIWHVPHEVKKLAICRDHVPLLFGLALRAWNKLVGILRGPAEEETNPEGEIVARAEPGREIVVRADPERARAI